MKRETRANWWFLVLFVIVSAPGAAILFHKKLDPTSPRMDEPDPVLTQLPYMTPLPAPPGIKWIVPGKTRQWLQDLLRSRTGSNAILSAINSGPEWEPVISSDHLIQVIAINGGANEIRYELLLWNISVPVATGAIRVEIENTGSKESVHQTQVNSVNLVVVPPEVRHELVALGFSRPPAQVTWVEASSDHELPLHSQRITVECTDSSEPLHSWVDIAGWSAKSETSNDGK